MSLDARSEASRSARLDFLLEMNTLEKRGADDDQTSSSITLTSGDPPAYPRKRVALACEVCRLRKTRCDAEKPSCSFCSKLDIECVYRGPSKSDRPSNEGEGTVSRLEKIESTLQTMSAILEQQQQKQSRQQRQQGPSKSKRMLDQASPVSHHSEPSVTSPATSVVSASRQAIIPRMPNLFAFKGPAPWCYDCTEDFFSDQLEGMTDLRNLREVLEIDLLRPHLWRLQQSFVENVLKWLPLFDHETALKHLQAAQISKYEVQSPSLCLVFLVYAIGALASDTGLFTESFDELSGAGYYVRAYEIMKDFPPLSKDLCILQCRTLEAWAAPDALGEVNNGPADLRHSIYFLYAMRPLESWHATSQVSQNCISLLRAGLIERESPAYRDAFQRIYWICYIIDSELEICLELPTSGLKAYETVVNLPGSHYEEEGMYYLLALTSLRKLMVEVVPSAGPRGFASTAYAPVVAMELRNQIDDWFHHLPTSLRFPPDHSLLFDKRRAYLRCQYHALIAVVFWPFVARSKEPLFSGKLADDEESERVQRGANECLNACRNFLKGTDEILTQKTIDSHVIVRSYFTCAIILLLTFDHNDESLGSLDDKMLLEYALENISNWKVVPFFRRSIEELERIARIMGLTTPR